MTSTADLITLRAPHKDEAGQIADVVRAISAEVGVDDTTDATDVLHGWSEPGIDRERHARVVTDGDRIVAAVSLNPYPPMAWGFGAVLPPYRGRGIGSALLDWMVAAARAEHGVDTLYTGSNIKFSDALALIGSRGFTHARTFYRMVHRNPATTAVPTMPEGIRVDTTLQGDALVTALNDGHNNSFIDHWNFQPWTAEETAHFLTHPDVKPELLLVAFGPDDAVAGINLCFLEEGDGFVHGTVGVLGTTRPYRGIGLGGALLRLGVRALADRGATLVDLGVDSENMTGALGMYERAGFERDQERHTFRLDVS